LYLGTIGGFRLSFNQRAAIQPISLLLLPPVRTGMPTDRREKPGMKIVDARRAGSFSHRELSAVVPVTCP